MTQALVDLVIRSDVVRKKHSPIDQGVQTVARLFGSQLNDRSLQMVFLAVESLFDSAGSGQSTVFFCHAESVCGEVVWLVVSQVMYHFP